MLPALIGPVLDPQRSNAGNAGSSECCYRLVTAANRSAPIGDAARHWHSAVRPQRLPIGRQLRQIDTLSTNRPCFDGVQIFAKLIV